jgi:leader peptidase (prepilin peptidase) / N-methyltransferase
MDEALLLVAALFGLIMGSFVNVVIHRLPRMLEQQWAQDVALWLAEHDGSPEPTASPGTALGDAPGTAPYNLARPGSHCPTCGQALAWRDNIPLLSYLLLRGRCRACQSPIGWRYPAVELLTALLFAACAWRWGLGASAMVWAAFAATLLALACIDADTQLLPDALTLPLLWGGLISAAAGWSQTALSDALWGAVAGYLLLWLVQQGFALATGKQGIGQGDFKLLAALGAWLGWQALLPLLLLACLSGAAVGLGLRWSGRLGAGQPLAFGPYLAMAGAAVMWLAPPYGLWP